MHVLEPIKRALEPVHDLYKKLGLTQNAPSVVVISSPYMRTVSSIRLAGNVLIRLIERDAPMALMAAAAMIYDNFNDPNPLQN
jgi:hypothetical protein